MRKKRFSWKQFSVSILIPIFLIICVIYGNKTITTISETTPSSTGVTVIIDAGHGGPDGGAVSLTGVYESNLNLQIALRLNDLMHLLGIRTHMIRTDDRTVATTGNTIAQKKFSDLKSRVKTVNLTENCLLLSIHQNIFPDSRYKGAQIFYSETTYSKEFAELMQEQFIKTINPESNRKCKPAKDIYLMDNINTTGILIECGFLSNQEEEMALRTDVYQKKICCVIAASTSLFLHKYAIT